MWASAVPIPRSWKARSWRRQRSPRPLSAEPTCLVTRAVRTTSCPRIGSASGRGGSITVTRQMAISSVKIDQGDFSRSSVAPDARIGGFTLGRLLSEGERIDFVGKVAAFRHFEEDEDNGNFWSYAAYIMARGKGYSPWSKEEWFRWGLRLRYVVRRNRADCRAAQAIRRRCEGQHVALPELSRDDTGFPFRRISKANWLQRCYAGLTIVHGRYLRHVRHSRRRFGGCRLDYGAPGVHAVSAQGEIRQLRAATAAGRTAGSIGAGARRLDAGTPTIRAR